MIVYLKGKKKRNNCCLCLFLLPIRYVYVPHFDFFFCSSDDYSFLFLTKKSKQFLYLYSFFLSRLNYPPINHSFFSFSYQLGFFLLLFRTSTRSFIFSLFALFFIRNNKATNLSFYFFLPCDIFLFIDFLFHLR